MPTVVMGACEVSPVHLVRISEVYVVKLSHQGHCHVCLLAGGWPLVYPDIFD